MKTFALLFLLLVPVVSAQTNTPRFDRTEWVLLSADAAARGLDVYSTRRALNGGNREQVLPGWIANHTPVMTAYSGSIVLTQYWAARKLFAHGHRRWAHVITAMDVSVTAPSAVHNMFMPLCVPPAKSTMQGCQLP